jgi:hypothetical protein
VSSRRRLYLNLKQSITKLFKTPAHYLKEMTGKRSLFEKPYLDKDYRDMHFHLPVPDWTWPEIEPGKLWPKTRKAIFIFDDGTCTFAGESGDCGELIKLDGWIAMVPPGSADKRIQWIVTSSDLEGAQVVNVIPSLGGNSVSVEVQLGDEFTGTVILCAKAFLTEGYFLAELVYEVPEYLNGVKVAAGWSPSLKYAMTNLPVMWQRKKSEAVWDCGCIDLEVNCCDDSGMSWDSDTSASTIQRFNDCVVAIKDSLGSGGPYAWSVSGTGYSLDYSETTGLLNTLNADGTACNPAIITVTGCDGKEVEGEVWCTAGAWVNKYSCNYSAQAIWGIPECCCFYVLKAGSLYSRYESYMYCLLPGVGPCTNYCGEYGWWEDGCENTDPACTKSLGNWCHTDNDTPPKDYYWTTGGGSKDDWEC